MTASRPSFESLGKLDFRDDLPAEPYARSTPKRRREIRSAALRVLPTFPWQSSKPSRSRRLHKVQTPFNPRDTLVNPIHSQRLSGKLRLNIANLGNGVPDGPLQVRHSKLKVGHI